MSGPGRAAAATGEARGRWGRVALELVWIAVKLTCVAALVNRNAADFIYAGF